jgi:hypothetical protein
MMIKKELNEPVLPMDYPIYSGYCYVVNGSPVVSMVTGDCHTLLNDLKERSAVEAYEVRRCDLVGRGLL